LSFWIENDLFSELKRPALEIRNEPSCPSLGQALCREPVPFRSLGKAQEIVGSVKDRFGPAPSGEPWAAV